jgi:hypothetical protein
MYQSTARKFEREVPIVACRAQKTRNEVARKGQFALELMPFIFLAVLILTVFVVVIAGRITGLQNRDEQSNLQQVTLMLDEEIRIAASVNDGYERDFWLPIKINGKAYSIVILGNTTIRASTGSYESSIVTFKVLGQPIAGENHLRKYDNTITLN